MNLIGAHSSQHRGKVSLRAQKSTFGRPSKAILRFEEKAILNERFGRIAGYENEKYETLWKYFKTIGELKPYGFCGSNMRLSLS